MDFLYNNLGEFSLINGDVIRANEQADSFLLDLNWIQNLDLEKEDFGNDIRIESQGESTNNIYSKTEDNPQVSDTNQKVISISQTILPSSDDSWNSMEGIKVKVDSDEKSATTRENQKSLTERKDVVNRAILRGIKKYYLNWLYDHLPEYKQKRICRVNKTFLFRDIKKILDSAVDSTEFESKCIFSILRHNNVDFVFSDASDRQLVAEFFSCIQRYSHKKLQILANNRFFQTIFEKVYENREIFFKINPLMNERKTVYEAGMNEIHKNLLNSNQVLGMTSQA